MARIRFEDNEKKIHTIDTEDGCYLEEQTVIGEDNDYLVFSVYFPDETEIMVAQEVFYKLQSAGLKINIDPRVWFDALDNHSYVIVPEEKCTLRGISKLLTISPNLMILSLGIIVARAYPIFL